MLGPVGSGARRLGLTVGLLALNSTGCKHRESAVLTDISDAKYHVGEQWTYRTRLGEERSTLTIGKVEASPKLGVIVHISLAGLRIKNSHASKGFSDTIAHMPFAEAALDKSVTALMTTAAVPPTFADGYGEWRRAFDDGKAGVFTITVSEGVDFMEQVLTR
jgi:hypothetical protein